MPNLIITKICNLECSYCFAWNKKQTKLIWWKTQMDISLFVLYLKHLKINNEKKVRLLWWEPLLHTKIRDILIISIRWGFNVLIFSNLALSHSYLWKIFENLPLDYYSKITVNINLNSFDSYKKGELDFLLQNAIFLKNKWVKIIISTMLNIDLDLDYIFSIADKIWTSFVKFKPVNWKKYDKITSSRDYWSFSFSIIEMYSKKYNISFSCGLSKYIFTENELVDIKSIYWLDIKFWCNANGWKYDIDINWDIFRCFPLENIYKWKNINLKDYYLYNIKNIILSLKNIYDTWNNQWNCLSSKI